MYLRISRKLKLTAGADKVEKLNWRQIRLKDYLPTLGAPPPTADLPLNRLLLTGDGALRVQDRRRAERLSSPAVCGRLHGPGLPEAVGQLRQRYNTTPLYTVKGHVCVLKLLFIVCYYVGDQQHIKPPITSSYRVWFNYVLNWVWLILLYLFLQLSNAWEPWNSIKTIFNQTKQGDCSLNLFFLAWQWL